MVTRKTSKTRVLFKLVCGPECQTEIADFKIINRISVLYPEIVPLSTLKACNAMNWPGGAAISLHVLASPLTYAVYPWYDHCKRALMQKQWRIFNNLHFQDTGRIRINVFILFRLSYQCISYYLIIKFSNITTTTTSTVYFLVFGQWLNIPVVL